MLLKVGIDPDAGPELTEGVKGPGRLLIRRLAERCLLVAESPASARDLGQAFREAGSPELRQVIAQLVSGRLELPEPTADTRQPTPIRDLEGLDQVASWRGLVDLLLVSKLRAEWLDLAGEATDPEVASLRDALNAEAFERVEAQWTRSVPVGQNREHVWREVFAPFSARATHVYVVDGYFATNLYQGLHASGRKGAKPGPEWFLGHLARSRVRFIRVASSNRHVRAKGLDPQHVREAIIDWFTCLGAGTDLDLRLVEGDFPHGRRIAFDGWAGFELHKGLASFDLPSTREQITLNASLELASEVRAEYRALA